MKVRPDELRAIRSIEEMAKYVGELEGEVQRQTHAMVGLVRQAQKMATKYEDRERGMQRYITRLQVRLQNRAEEHCTVGWRRSQQVQ